MRSLRNKTSLWHEDNRDDASQVTWLTQELLMFSKAINMLAMGRVNSRQGPLVRDQVF